MKRSKKRLENEEKLSEEIKNSRIYYFGIRPLIAIIAEWFR